MDDTAPLEPQPLRRVLVVEDEVRVARLVAHMLRANVAGAQVDVATRLSDALTAASEGPLDCILLDLSLPDADGLDGVRQLRTAVPNVPVVVLSDSDDEEHALRAVQEGAQDYLIKGELDGALLARALRYAVERKRVETRLAQQALHDPLTGLPNRALFVDRVEHALARRARAGGTVAVMFLDLDLFKTVNDRLGHEAGDALLIEVAARLTGVLRSADTVSRFGGDEFTILCEEVTDERRALAIADRLRAAVARPVALPQGHVPVDISIGITLAQPDAVTPADLLREADAALYRAKERGRGRTELFDADLRERAQQRLARERALRAALERDEVHVHYQPIVALASGDIVGFEALMRWAHPEHGLIAARDFLACAEEIDSLGRMSAWVLERGCHAAAGWETRSGQAPLWLSVNVGPQELADPDFAPRVRRTLGHTGLAPERLWLEVPEEALTRDPITARRALAPLQALGVRIALDDFGRETGALAALTALPLNALKLDRRLVALAPERHGAVRAVIAVAAALDLLTIGEGVETGAERAALLALGCDLGQGLALGAPRPVELVPA